MKLRDYQERALEEASAASAHARGILIQLATGLGKTRVATEACFRHVKMGGVPLFVAPRRELVNQAKAALEARGLHDGHDCYVRTIQQLVTPGAEKLPGVTMIVLDEARHYLADEWSKLRAQYEDATVLGLDATPAREDGRGLGLMFDVIISPISIGEAIAAGWLVPCDTIRPEHALAPGELAQDPVDAYMQYAHNTSAVLFAGSVQLAVEYAKRLNEIGVRSAPVHGDMLVSARDFALAEYERGAIKVLCNMQLLTEGWDAPRTETVILAGACGSPSGFLQRVGRGMRLFPGKQQVRLLDLRGVSHTFGDVDEPRTYHLEGKAIRRAVDDVDIRFCPVCGAPTATPQCEQCGYAGELRKRKPRILGLPMDRFARQRAMPDEQRAKALAGYLRVARARGHRPGWAYRCFEHKYGPVTTELKRLAARMG